MHPSYLTSLCVCCNSLPGSQGLSLNTAVQVLVIHTTPSLVQVISAHLDTERNACRLELLLDNFSMCKMHAFLYF